MEKYHTTIDGSHLHIGQAVDIKGRDEITIGVIRFIGPADFPSSSNSSFGSIWIGVELQKPIGKNNGSINGITYFTCPENHGLFVRPVYVLPLSTTSEDDNLIKFTSLSNLLKLKISNSMEILEKQMQLISSQEHNKSYSEMISHLLANIHALHQQETDLITAFYEKLHAIVE